MINYTTSITPMKWCYHYSPRGMDESTVRLNLNATNGYSHPFSFLIKTIVFLGCAITSPFLTLLSNCISVPPHFFTYSLPHFILSSMAFAAGRNSISQLNSLFPSNPVRQLYPQCSPFDRF